MKKLVLVGLVSVCFFMAIGTATAASIYDGLWVSSTGDFVTIDTKNGVMLATVLDDYYGTWDVMAADLYGNNATLFYIYGYSGVETIYDVVFYNSGYAIATQTYCAPLVWDGYCEYSNYTSFELQKIW